MTVLKYKIDVSLFIDLIALYMNPNTTFVTMYDLMVVGNTTDFSHIPHVILLSFSQVEMQVFDERQELIKTMKGSRLKKTMNGKV